MSPDWPRARHEMRDQTVMNLTQAHKQAQRTFPNLPPRSIEREDFRESLAPLCPQPKFSLGKRQLAIRRAESIKSLLCQLAQAKLMARRLRQNTSDQFERDLLTA